jgi:hypothetical protein
MKLSDVKLPTRKKAVDLPERPKDRNMQVRARLNEKIDAKNATTTLQGQQITNQLEDKIASMDDRQKMCLKTYSEILMIAAKNITKANFGPAGSMEQGLAKMDEVTADVTEVILKGFKQNIDMNQFFAVLGSAAGYQAGLAMGKSGKELTDGMVESAMVLFEGGLRMNSEATKTLYKNQKVIRPATKPIH